MVQYCRQVRHLVPLLKQRRRPTNQKSSSCTHYKVLSFCGSIKAYLFRIKLLLATKYCIYLQNRKKVTHLSDYLLAYPFVTKPFSINLHAFHYNMFAHAKSKLYRLKSLIFTNSYYMTNLFYPGDLTNFYHSHLIIPLFFFFLNIYIFLLQLL